MADSILGALMAVAVVAAVLWMAISIDSEMMD
jgi:hypothetical protein